MSSRTLQKKCSRFALKYTCLYARVLCVYMYIYKCVPVYRERWLRLKCDEIIESLYCHTPYLASGVSFIRYIILDTVTNALYLIIPRIDPAMNSSYRSSTAFRIFYHSRTIEIYTELRLKTVSCQGSADSVSILRHFYENERKRNRRRSSRPSSFYSHGTFI